MMMLSIEEKDKTYVWHPFTHIIVYKTNLKNCIKKKSGYKSVGSTAYNHLHTVTAVHKL